MKSIFPTSPSFYARFVAPFFTIICEALCMVPIIYFWVLVCMTFIQQDFSQLLSPGFIFSLNPILKKIILFTILVRWAAQLFVEMVVVPRRIQQNILRGQAQAPAVRNPDAVRNE